jgi:hypothetical protein
MAAHTQAVILTTNSTELVICAYLSVGPYNAREIHYRQDLRF